MFRAGFRAAAVFVVVAVAFVSACDEGKKPLTVTGLKPNVGPYIGGDPVAISGSGFKSPPQGIKVYFGKQAAKRVIIKSDTELIVEPPAGQIGETVDVEVQFDDARSGKLPQAYKYIDPVGGPGTGGTAPTPSSP